MTRSGYSDDCDGAELNLWRGAVNSAIRGKRGQAFLREMVQALDGMEDKKLENEVLVDSQTGGCCALGAVAKARGLDIFGLKNGRQLNVNDARQVGELLGIARAMAAEIAYENDEGDFIDDESPEARWRRMRAWAVGNIKGDK